MSTKTKKLRIAGGTEQTRAALASGEWAPLKEFLRAKGWCRGTFYLHPEIPSLRHNGRVYVSRTAFPPVRA